MEIRFKINVTTKCNKLINLKKKILTVLNESKHNNVFVK